MTIELTSTSYTESCNMMASCPVIVVVSVVLLILPLTASVKPFRYTNFIKVSQHQVTKGHSLENLTNVGRIECGQKCLENDDCTAFSVGTSQRCQLIGESCRAFNAVESPGTELFYLVSYQYLLIIKVPQKCHLVFMIIL